MPLPPDPQQQTSNTVLGGNAPDTSRWQAIEANVAAMNDAWGDDEDDRFPDGAKDDPYWRPIGTAAQTFYEALGECLTLARTLDQTSNKSFARMAGIVRSRMEMAHQKTSSGGDADGAAAAEHSKLWDATVSSSMMKIGQDEPTRLAQKALDAEMAFEKAVRMARLDYDSPTSRRKVGDDLSDGDLAAAALADHRDQMAMRSSAVRTHLRSLDESYQNAVALDDADTQMKLEEIGEPICCEILEMGASQLAARLSAYPGGSSSDAADRVRRTALRLLSQFEQRRKERTPQSLVLGEKSIEAHEILFNQVVGNDPYMLNANELRAWIYSPPTAPWSVKVDWPIRFLTKPEAPALGRRGAR